MLAERTGRSADGEVIQPTNAASEDEAQHPTQHHAGHELNRSEGLRDLAPQVEAGCDAVDAQQSDGGARQYHRPPMAP